MSSQVEIRGAGFSIQRSVDTDTIIKSRHCTSADPAALAPHCLAELRQEHRFRAGEYSLIVCNGTFGVGSARIQAPLALAGAGVRAVVARAFAPIFFENCINGAMLLPVTATLSSLPATGTGLDLVVSGRTVTLSWHDHRISLTCALPEWALAGRGWMEVIEEQAEVAGGLEALRERGLALR